MKEKPFIHCFRTYNCCYFYDFNTNAIVRIPESVYVHLQHLEKGTANISECDADVNEILNRLTEQGFLSSHHWCKIEHPASRLLENYLEGSVQSLTLQVTQQCNLKCDGLTSNCATVIIDSDTGKVVDVMTPNPLYDNGVVLHWTRVSGVQANYNYDPVD